LGIYWYYTEYGTDDGYATDGGYYINNGSWLYAGLFGDSTTQNTFHVISDVTIPPKAVIKSAYLRAYFDVNVGVSVKLKVSAEKALNPAACVDNADYFSRSLTTNKVDWDLDGEIFNWEDSPDLSDMISEIVNQDGWVAGNDIQFFLRDDGSAVGDYGNIVAFDYDDSYTYAVRLMVEWEYPKFDVNMQIPSISWSVNEKLSSFLKYISLPEPSIQCNAEVIVPPIGVNLSLPEADPGGNVSINVPSIKVNIGMEPLAYAGNYVPSTSLKVSLPIPTYTNDYNKSISPINMAMVLPIPLVRATEHFTIVPYNYLDIVKYNDLDSIFYNDSIREPESISNSNVVVYDEAGIMDFILLHAMDVIIKEEVNGILELTFSLAYNDVNISKVLNEKKVRVYGKDFYIRRISKLKDFGGEVDIFCEAVWYELGNISPISIFDENGVYSEFTWESSNPAIPLIYILRDTEWDVGIISEELLDIVRDFKVNSNMNVLECLKSVVDFWGGELEFDFINYRVNFLNQVGGDPGVGILAGKNMKEITLESDSTDVITRLYPYGKDGLSIAEVNGGVPFVEDYTYYSKVKVGIITDERFTNAEDLKDKAIELLTEVSKESYLYTIKASDLSFLGDWSHEVFKLGDYVKVFDKDLGIDIKTRILKMDYNVSYPEDNILELSAKTPSLEDLLSDIVVGEDTEEILNVTIDDDAITGNFELYFNYGLAEELYLGVIELGETASGFDIIRDVSNISIDHSGGDYSLGPDGEPKIICNSTICKLTIDKMYLKYESDKASIMPINNGYAILSVDEGINTLVPITSLNASDYLDNITLISNTKNEKRVKLVFNKCLNDGAIEHAFNQYEKVVKKTVFTAYSEDGESPLDIYVYD
jgi:phage minor structural protein